MADRDDASARALGGFIRAQREVADLTLRQLADLANVSNAYLSQVERGLYRPSARVLKNVAEALDVSAQALFARAGLLDDDRVEGDIDVEDAIRRDDRLTPEQQDALIRVYRGFRSP